MLFHSSTLFGMGEQNTNEFSNLCSEKENTYYGVDVNDEFSFPTPAPDVFCSSDESIISPSVTSSPLPVGSCYLHESTYGMQTSVSPITTLDTSDNAVPDQFCTSSSSSTIADSTITNELDVSSPIASPSYPPLSSSHPFLGSLPLYSHSPCPFLCMQPISLKVCKQKNSNARGDSLSHIYLQLRNLCKNREGW
jgi:hypothetical protein